MSSDLIVVANGIVDRGYDAKLRHHAPPSEKEISICQTWLRKFAEPTKTIRQKRSSYGYKHVVENWTEAGLADKQEDGFEQIDLHGRKWKGPRHYISNGAFIVAAQREGYRVRRIDGGLNAWFNITLPRRLASSTRGQ